MNFNDLVAESSKKTTSSVQDINADKPPFGSRFLTEDDDVWSKNAWDHVPPPGEHDDLITKSLMRQRSHPVSAQDQVNLNMLPAKHWENFYKLNANNFFQNRKWLQNEFPELVAALSADAGSVSIAEIGCGAGNSLFPLLSINQNPNLHFHAYDYSSHAVKLVQRDPLYLSPPAGTVQASVWDVTSLEGMPLDLAPGTVDIIILVFVMSALHPDEWGQAIGNIHKILKPGGVVLLRDYGRHDMTQLRFKKYRLLEENFYARGDKTRVYYFDLDELSLLFTGIKVSDTGVSADLRTTTETEQDDDESINDLSTDFENNRSLSNSHVTQEQLEKENPCQPTANPATIHRNLQHHLTNCPPHPLFSAEQLGVDRRLLVNRKRQLKMYRVWMQGKFRKL